MRIGDEFFMSLALNEAWKHQLLTYPNPPVGCVLLGKNGEILALSAHKKAGWAHAELSAAVEALGFKKSAAFFAAFCKKPDFAAFLREDLGVEVESNSVLTNLQEELAQAALSEEGFAQFLSDFFTRNAALGREFVVRNCGDLFEGASAFVTLEPCSHEGRTPPCARLLAQIGVRRVVIGAKERSLKARGGAEILQESGASVVFGVKQKECEILLEPFFAWSGAQNFSNSVLTKNAQQSVGLGCGRAEMDAGFNRQNAEANENFTQQNAQNHAQNANFTFYKLALTTNGVTTGGVISSLESRTHMHRIRDLIDLLVIGGNTVRLDNPLLDARLCGGRASDVMIFSRQTKFAPSLRCFGVSGRKVCVSGDFNEVFKRNFVMIEGGFLHDLSRLSHDRVKWLLLYHSPTFSLRQNLQADVEFEILHQRRCGGDTVTWAKLV